MVESNNQPKESLKKLSKDFNQNPYKSYQYPKEDKEILLCHIHRFTLDRLLTCFDNLHLPLEVKITNQPEY
ncbi:MAG: hypothetical protein I3270_01525 [Candidatus Moeniiplasma glomeromycotorum]|nr:hypothetical protein [Candidatus Moeniiplasma glomeromycotorum]MCE8162387.1 hypothetical protein [Candidatus Moeniiplasma glomeromycotorum]MCE8166312.1 hypothetical protein [Candidatus Moeniiplasma glomeromycotorum]MCE8166794.1 hypothetical protein [Candidatus Moeniiplasma glomeromycotorum]